MYMIYVKGWGEYEEGWYPQVAGKTVLDVKEKVFKNCQNKYAEYYIKNKNKIVEKGFYKDGKMVIR